MSTKTDWLEILFRCKENVKAKIRPYLKTGLAEQPVLGMGAGGDPMKPVDLAAEKAIVEVLEHHLNAFTLVSEESGVKKFGMNPAQCYVIVDPIDGTTNLIRGLPFYATSIAVSTMPLLSTVFAALVTDLFRDTTYTAIKSGGAHCDGKRIATSQLTTLEDAVIGLDLNSYKVKAIAPYLSDLIERTGHIRHFGANALELCYVAEGLTEAFVDVRGKLRVTDMAAGYLILKEAGGVITSPEGKALDTTLDPIQKIKFIASGNKQLHRKILGLVRLKC